MLAYKLYVSDTMGFGSEEKYFLNSKKAEKEFYEKLQHVISNKHLASKDDLDGSNPWKICTKDFLKETVIMVADYHYRGSWNNPECGQESEIYCDQIILEEILINE